MPLDLHVLSLSLAFILSQDQTLRCCYLVLFFSEICKDRPLEKRTVPRDDNRVVMPDRKKLYCALRIDLGTISPARPPCGGMAGKLSSCTTLQSIVNLSMF